jgi:histidyl-tRNA synthetase
MKYSALKGAQDIFPPEIYIWQKIEESARDIFSVYGFQELRAPIIESTDIFIRRLGETTDIVEKEMYTFSDKAGRRITLRPEGTAPVVRCYEISSGKLKWKNLSAGTQGEITFEEVYDFFKSDSDNS